MGQRFADAAPLSTPDTVARDTYMVRQKEIQEVMRGTQLLRIRAAILTRNLPFPSPPQIHRRDLLALMPEFNADGQAGLSVSIALLGCQGT
jgi:hypothetical protein